MIAAFGLIIGRFCSGQRERLTHEAEKKEDKAKVDETVLSIMVNEGVTMEEGVAQQSSTSREDVNKERRITKERQNKAIRRGDTDYAYEEHGEEKEDKEEEEGIVVEANVLVLGAGMSGVTVAKRLKEEGVEGVVVVEGSGRVGGRVKALSFGGITVELGANWVHR